MDMVKLHSMEDMMSLPVTSWNIQQPAGEFYILNIYNLFDGLTYNTRGHLVSCVVF